MRVAVIGTGVSGASLAYILSSAKQGHEVVVFEQQSCVGMDAQSVDVEEVEEGEVKQQRRRHTYRMDMPPRTLSRSYYPNLCAMYDDAGIALEEWTWNYSVSQTASRQCHFQVTDGFFGNCLPSLTSHPTQWLRPSTYAIIFDSLRLFRAADLATAADDARDDTDKPAPLHQTTLEDYLQQNSYSDAFVFCFLLPMLSMVCTCSYTALLQYPVDVLLRFFACTSTSGQLRAKHGSADAGNRLLRLVHDQRMSTSVSGVYRDGDQPRVTFERDGVEHEERFDAVVLATPAHVTRRLLKDSSALEQQALQAFDHEESTVMLHRDERLMPARKQHWSSVNYLVDQTKSSVCTLLMPAKAVFQSWMMSPPSWAQSSPSVLASARFTRPLMNTRSFSSVQALQQCQGKGNVWFCGSYATYAVPLQESCVNSALIVARHLGVSPDWTVAFVRPRKKHSIIFGSTLQIIPMLLLLLLLLLLSPWVI